MHIGIPLLTDEIKTTTACSNAPSPAHEHSYWIVWLERFDAHLRCAKRAPGTRLGYRNALKLFSAHCVDPLSPQRPSIYAWARARRSAVGAGTLNNEISAVRCFYGWLVDMRYISADPRGLLPRQRRVPARLPRVLSQRQVGCLLAAPDIATWQGFRDHVILRVLYETGITASECMRLELGSVGDEALTISAYHLRDYRVVPCSVELCTLLEEWQRLRRTARPGKNSALFVTRHGAAFRSAKTVWTVVNRYARAALGVGRGYETLEQTAKRRPWGEFYPHLLRASMASHLLESSGNVRAVQLLLGHATPETTLRYFEMDLDVLRAEHSKLRKDYNAM